jgi:hypothetical protein
MTASKPDMKVLAVDWELSSREPRDGYTLVLCEMPDDSAAALPVGCERDWCSPGFVVGVVAALAEAGIGKAGGPGVEMLAQREASWRGIVTRVRNAVGERSIDPTSRVRSAVSRANALAQAVQSIGQTLADAASDIEAITGNPPTVASSEALTRVGSVMALAMGAAFDIVESVAADVVAPTQTAREVLAAHGWATDDDGDMTSSDGRFVELYKGEAGVYNRNDGKGYVPFSPTELRAFAQLAEESQP